MSIAYSSTDSKNGILQGIERTLFGDGNFGYITDNTTRLKSFTGQVNLALDRVLAIIFKVGGTWQFDDNNQTDFPIITTDIVSGQRDYTFTTDNTGNLILEIYKVFVADSGGIFEEITPRDPASESIGLADFTSGQDPTGVPTRYDKLGNGTLLDPVPDYNYTDGLKMYINRETTYFLTTDTTKKPGIAGLFHEYFILRPAYIYARDNNLKIVARLERDLDTMERDIMDYYGQREKDVRHRIIPRITNFR